MVSDAGRGGGTGSERHRSGLSARRHAARNDRRAGRRHRRRVSTTALAADTHYTLRASGEFTIGGPGFGDAEYAYSGTNQGPIDNCFDSPAGTDLGIGIDDANVGSTTKSPDWGPFNAAHEYTADFVGTGNPISVNYHDCGHSDNGPAAGRLPLTLSIFGPPTDRTPVLRSRSWISPTSRARTRPARRCTRRTIPTLNAPIDARRPRTADRLRRVALDRPRRHGRHRLLPGERDRWTGRRDAVRHDRVHADRGACPRRASPTAPRNGRSSPSSPTRAAPRRRSRP